jgi:hypothetical protein
MKFWPLCVVGLLGCNAVLGLDNRTLIDGGATGSGTITGSGSSSGVASGLSSGASAGTASGTAVNSGSGNGSSTGGGASGVQASGATSAASGASSGGGSGSSGSTGMTGSRSGSGGESCQSGYALCNGEQAQCCPPGDAACKLDAKGNVCLFVCASRDQCSSKACGPLVDLSGNPIGPYVCKPNDGKLYDGCGPSEPLYGSCTGGFSCYQTSANTAYFCGIGCTGKGGDCGDAGNVCCNPLIPPCGNPGGGGCMPGVCSPCL